MHIVFIYEDFQFVVVNAAAAAVRLILCSSQATNELLLLAHAMCNNIWALYTIIKYLSKLIFSRMSYLLEVKTLTTCHLILYLWINVYIYFRLTYE